MILRVSLIAATVGMWLATPAWAAPFFFSTGNPDGRLGAVSRPASPGKVETETADDLVLTQTTVINRATITGLIPLRGSVSCGRGGLKFGQRDISLDSEPDWV